MQGLDLIDGAVWRYLLSGMTVEKPVDSAKPKAGWVTDQMWTEVCTFSALEQYPNFTEDFVTNIEEWKRFYDSETSYEDPLPGGWSDKLTQLQQMAVLRAVARQDDGSYPKLCARQPWQKVY